MEQWIRRDGEMREPQWAAWRGRGCGDGAGVGEGLAGSEQGRQEVRGERGVGDVARRLVRAALVPARCEGGVLGQGRHRQGP